MFTVNDFIAQYKNYTDGQLFFIHSKPDNYSREANDAAKIIIERKGGLDALSKRLESAHIKQREINRIKKETEELGTQGFDASFLKTNANSDILSTEEVHGIIDDKYEEVLYDINDRQITPNTIAGAVMGGVIASIIGGILWGLQVIYSGRIFYLLFIGLIFLCYGIIKIFTKKTKNNKAVYISTIIAVIISVLIGQILLNIFGVQDQDLIKL